MNVTEWEAAGERHQLAGYDIFTLTAPALEDERDEPLLVLHGFPSSSYDFAAVLDDLRRTRRVFLLDFLGYGLSSKPDSPYPLSLQADVVVAYTAALGLDRLALLTHDMGDSVGGELLASDPALVDALLEVEHPCRGRVVRGVARGGAAHVLVAIGAGAACGARTNAELSFSAGSGRRSSARNPPAPSSIIGWQATPNSRPSRPAEFTRLRTTR